MSPLPALALSVFFVLALSLVFFGKNLVARGFWAGVAFFSGVWAAAGWIVYYMSGVI